MSGAFALFKWQSLFANLDIFAQGFITTILVSLLGLVFSIIIGVILGMFATTNNFILKAINRVYVEVIQNTPLVLQIFFLYNGLPHVDIVLPLFSIGVIGVSVYHGAYIAEVVRSGILAINRGQFEAGYSQGFTNVQVMRYIVLPQAVRLMLPPLTNQCVNLIKNTSVMAMIAGGDLMYQANSWAGYTLNYAPAYLTVAVLYFVLCFPLTQLACRLEEKSKQPFAALAKSESAEKAGAAV